MKFYFAFLLGFLGIFSLGAQTVPKPIIFVTEIWPPFRIPESPTSSEIVGIDIDLITLLSQEMGRPIQVQRHPFARALDMMRTGQADLISGIAYTEARDEFIEYIYPSYAEVRPAFVTQAGKGQTIQDYDDLYGPSIGYSLNSAYFEPFNSDSRINKVGISTEDQLLRMVALGRVDIIIGTEPNLSYDIARLGLGTQVEPTAYVPPFLTPLYLGVSANSPLVQDIPRIEAFIRQISQDGRFEAILEKYR